MRQRHQLLEPWTRISRELTSAKSPLKQSIHVGMQFWNVQFDCVYFQKDRPDGSLACIISPCARPKTWRILFTKCQNRAKLSTQRDQEQNGVDGGIFLVFSSCCVLPCGEMPASCYGKVQCCTHGSWWQTMGEIAARFAELEEELVSEFHIWSSTWCEEDAWRGVNGFWTLTKGSYFLSFCVMGVAQWVYFSKKLWWSEWPKSMHIISQFMQYCSYRILVWEFNTPFSTHCRTRFPFPSDTGEIISRHCTLYMLCEPPEMLKFLSLNPDILLSAFPGRPFFALLVLCTPVDFVRFWA